MFPRSLAAPSQTVAQRHRVPLPPSDSSRTDFELIAALLLRAPAPSASDNDDEDDDEDGRRAATILLLRLTYAQAHAQLSSIAQELELLRSAPPPSQPGTSDHADPSSSEEQTLWRLDAPARGSGPLLDSTGKVAHDLLRFSCEYLMLIRRCYSRCSHSRYCPLVQAATAQGSESRCSKRTTASRPCQSTNTSRLSGSAATFSLEEGKKTP